MTGLMPVAEALERLLSDVEPLETEQVPLEKANGRYLSKPVASTRTQPPFSASAMDGYAVRYDDISAGKKSLEVIGEAPAGHEFQGLVGAGETVRIFTGAPVPEGSDTILIQENAERKGDRIEILNAPSKHEYVRPAGLDFAEGDMLLTANEKLGYRQLALAAAMNHPSLPVYKQPVVAILATGDELVRPGANPAPDQIIASNHAGIAALVEDCGGIPLDLGIAPDEPIQMAQKVQEAIRAKADILVTLGGASVGDHDLVQDVLGEEGMELAFWRIAMRPGKPLMAGRLGKTKVLGLPGNPVSSLVCGLLFLKPLIEALTGRSETGSSETLARLGADLPENDRRQDYVRALLEKGQDGSLIATPFTKQDSSMLGLLAKSGCLIIRPPHAEAEATGSIVPVMVL